MNINEFDPTRNATFVFIKESVLHSLAVAPRQVIHLSDIPSARVFEQQAPIQR